MDEEHRPFAGIGDEREILDLKRRAGFVQHLAVDHHEPESERHEEKNGRNENLKGPRSKLADRSLENIQKKNGSCKNLYLLLLLKDQDNRHPKQDFDKIVALL